MKLLLLLTLRCVGAWAQSSAIGAVSGTGPAILQSVTSINVLAKGAKCDWNGSTGTDDTTSINNAILDAAVVNGTVLFPPNLCRTTTTLNVTSSNITLQGVGPKSGILFDPVNAAINDRALQINGQESAAFNVSGSIAFAATSFTVANSADIATAGIVVGDWLEIIEVDSGVGDIAYFDWVQVAAIAGSVITPYQPFRMAFPGTHGTVKYYKVILGRGVVVRDLSFTVNSSTTTLANPTVALGARSSKDVLLDNVTVQSPSGNGFFTYRNKGLTLRNCHAVSAANQANEFAANVDLTISGGNFDSEGAAGNTSAIQLDFGTGFFSVTGTHISAGPNIMFQMNYGVHDGVVSNNTLGYVVNAGIGNTIGINAVGASNVIVTGNRLIGGSGGSSRGISFTTASSMSPPVPSVGNTILGNSVNGFASPYGPQGDLLAISNGNTTAGGILIGNTFNPAYNSIYLNGLTGTGNYNFLSNTGGYLYINRPTAKDILFGENDNENQMVIKSGGNVGIGTVVPDTTFTVSKNTATLPSATAGSSIHIGGTDAVVNRVLFDSFAQSSIVTFRRANNTAASPSALTTNDRLGSFGAVGYGATAYGTTNNMFGIFASEPWTDIAQGSYLTFSTALNGSTAALERARIDNAGNVGIGQSIPVTKLDVNGDITDESVTSCNTGTKALGTDSTGKLICNANASGILSGTTASIGGSVLIAGACSSGTVSVTGAATSMTATASPAGGVDPTNSGALGVSIDARVSSANTVTVSVCSPIAGTPTAATYNVRVIP